MWLHLSLIISAKTVYSNKVAVPVSWWTWISGEQSSPHYYQALSLLRVRSLLGISLLFFSVSFRFSVNISIPRLKPHSWSWNELDGIIGVNGTAENILLFNLFAGRTEALRVVSSYEFYCLMAHKVDWKTGLSPVTEHRESVSCALKPRAATLSLRISEILSWERRLATSTSNLVLSFYKWALQGPARLSDLFKVTS